MIYLSYLFGLHLIVLFVRGIYYLGKIPDTTYSESYEINQLVFQADLTFPMLFVSFISLSLAILIAVTNIYIKGYKISICMWVFTCISLVANSLLYFNIYKLFSWAAG